MPDRISPSSPLTETLRALSRDRVRGTNTRKTVENTGNEQAAIESARGIEPLRQRLRQLTRGTDTHDPKTVTAIRDKVLQEILTWEFGAEFRHSTQFQPMLDAIGKTMELDENYRQQFVALLNHLQS